MFIDPFNIFDEDNDRVVFFNRGKEVSLFQFKDDIIRFYYLFKDITNYQILLYIKDDPYLFFVCFMALMQLNKHIILPASLSKDIKSLVIKDDGFIISNVDIEDINSSIFKKVFISDDCDNNNDSSSSRDEDKDFIFKKDYKGEISFFTSGSTSQPKKIKKNIRNLYEEIENIYNTQNKYFTPNSIIIASIAPYHIYGMLWSFLLPLRSKLRVDLDTVLSLDTFRIKLQNYSNIIFITTPSFLEKLISYSKGSEYKPLDAIYTSGSLLAKSLSEACYNTFKVCPIEIFGSTETGGVAFRQRTLTQDQWWVFPPVSVELDENNCLLVKSSFIEEGSFQMKDSVELIEDRKFLLLGRKDRLVKIFEKRISFPEMEAKYESNPFIKKAHIIVVEPNTLGLVASLSEEGSKFLKQNGKSKLVLSIRSFMLDYFNSSLLPKKIRTTFEIPTNTQGKILSNEILDMFSNNVQEPVVDEIKMLDNDAFITLTFLKDAIYFQGHFPNYPILPGVVQLHFALFFIKRILNVKIEDYNVSKLKFSNMIFPQEEVSLHISSKNNRIICKYLKDEKICSSLEFTKK